jgi:penicillin-binding protein 1A
VWGKTGTTDVYGDAWFVGYTRSLTTAVWMGYPEGQSKPLYNIHGVAKVNGGSLPAQIFKRYMAKASAPDDSPPPTAPDLGGRTVSPVASVASSGSSGSGTSGSSGSGFSGASPTTTAAATDEPTQTTVKTSPATTLPAETPTTPSTPTGGPLSSPTTAATVPRSRTTTSFVFPTIPPRP